MTGPVHVEGAEPGDLLAVKIEAIATAERGFTCIMPGFGFLRDLFPKPFVVHWEMADGFARSKELPRVRIPGAPFMGVMGVAPSRELLQRIVTRESELVQRGGLAMPPNPAGALPAGDTIAAVAFRTIAPHENGGNMDIKQITAGSTLYLPVYVPGALFSVGDAHFAQGDGESCGTAIETTGTLIARFDLLKGEARRRNQTDPSYTTEVRLSERAAARRFYATTGICTRKDGRSESEDLTLAARNALVNMLDYLSDTYGYSPEQAYCLASVAVDLKVSQVVDVPNFIVSASLAAQDISTSRPAAPQAAPAKLDNATKRLGTVAPAMGVFPSRGRGPAASRHGLAHRGGGVPSADAKAGLLPLVSGDGRRTRGQAQEGSQRALDQRAVEPIDDEHQARAPVAVRPGGHVDGWMDEMLHAVDGDRRG